MTPLFLKKNVIQHFPFILNHTKILVKLLEEKVDQPTFNAIHFIHRCAADFVNGMYVFLNVMAFWEISLRNICNNAKIQKLV